MLEADSVVCNGEFAFGEGSSAYFNGALPKSLLAWTSPQGESMEFLVSLFTFGVDNRSRLIFRRWRCAYLRLIAEMPSASLQFLALRADASGGSI